MLKIYFNMRKPEASIIIACHNEEQMLPYSIEAVGQQAESVPNQELIIVVNGSTDASAEIARNSEIDMPVHVIETATPGKKHAMNLGMAAARSDFIVFNDADSIMPRDAVFHAINALETDKTRLVGAPRKPLRPSGEGFYEHDFASAFYLMNYARRTARPDQKTVQGWFMALNKTRLAEELEFPQGASPDDTWLSAFVGSRFGTEAIHYQANLPGEYISPTNEQDMLAQIARHSLCRRLVRHEHPNISDYFNQVEEYYAQTMTDAEFNKRWREETLKLGVDFDSWIDEYNTFKSRIGNVADGMFDTLVNMNGTWERIESSKSLDHDAEEMKHAS